MSGWGIAGLCIGAFVLWSLLSGLLEGRRLRELSSARADWTVEDFVKHFRGRGASPELARDVWDLLQELLGSPLPLLPSDRLWAEPLWLDREDMEYELEPLLDRHRILLDGRDARTVEELVLLLQACSVRE